MMTRDKPRKRQQEIRSTREKRFTLSPGVGLTVLEGKVQVRVRYPRDAKPRIVPTAIDKSHNATK